MKNVKLIILLIFFNSFLFADKKERTHNWNIGITSESSMLTKFKDANIALKAWVEDMGELYDIDIDIGFYEESGKLYEDFKLRKRDVLVIDIPFFFKHKKDLEKYIDEIWSLSIDNQKHSQYFLLGNKSKNLKSFKNLRNRTISIKRDDSIAENWLNKNSYLNHKSSAKNVLKKINEEKNDRRVLLNVFFGKVDYAIITKKAWEDMLSFNPSIEKKVEVLAKSKKIFIPFMGIHAKWINKETKRLFYEASSNLKTLKGGEQVIEIMKFDSVYKLDKRELNELDKYFQEYYHLEKMYK